MRQQIIYNRGQQRSGEGIECTGFDGSVLDDIFHNGFSHWFKASERISTKDENEIVLG